MRPSLPFMGLLASLVSFSPVWGIEESHGVNLSLDEGFGARASALSTQFASFQVSADAVANSPAGMNDVNDFTFSTAHAERFSEAQLDHFSMLIPLDARSTMGLSLARYGVSDIELRPVGTEYQSRPQGLFTVADYWVAGAFARRFGDFDIGGTVNLIYRSLDQAGLGMRGDLMASYTFLENYRFSTFYKGVSPSITRWSSGYAEYENPDMYLGFTGRIPTPYFYGSFFLTWESEGLFQENAQSTRSLEGARGLFHPGSAFQQSNLGAEYQFDFGLSLRAGIQELLSSRSMASAISLGTGYSWRGIVGVDYSFVPHPDLPSSHRIAMQLTPAFPKFMGKGYRPLKKSKAGISPTSQKAHLESKEHINPEQQLPANQGPYIRPVEKLEDETQSGADRKPIEAAKTTEELKAPSQKAGNSAPESVPSEPEKEVLED